MPLRWKMSSTASVPSSTKETAPTWMPTIFFAAGCAAVRSGINVAVEAAASPALRKSRRFFILESSEDVLKRDLLDAISGLSSDETERGTGRVGIGSAPVRMVQDVEHFPA